MDPRFSLANERTYLAWIRTAFALIAGGVVAAKALDFHHDTWRWIVATPPFLAGALVGLTAVRRWRTYEDAMREGRDLPVGRGFAVLGVGLAVYAALVLVASAIDG
jgi:putative membrane protein